MRRFRTYCISVIAGLIAAFPVLWISSRIEQQRAAEFMEKLRTHPPSPPANFDGIGYVAGGSFGPGMLTWFLAILIFTLVFLGLNRWQNGRGVDQTQKLI